MHDAAGVVIHIPAAGLTSFQWPTVKGSNVQRNVEKQKNMDITMHDSKHLQNLLYQSDEEENALMSGVLNTHTKVWSVTLNINKTVHKKAPLGTFKEAVAV